MTGFLKGVDPAWVDITLTYVEESGASVEEWLVRSGGLKWSITVKDWPFLSPENSLAVRVEMLSPGQTTWTWMEQDGRFFVQSDRTGLMWAPTHATVDGVEEDVVVSTTGGHGNSLDLEFLLPSGQEIYYDPVIELDSSQ